MYVLRPGSRSLMESRKAITCGYTFRATTKYVSTPAACWIPPTTLLKSTFTRGPASLAALHGAETSDLFTRRSCLEDTDGRVTGEVGGCKMHHAARRSPSAGRLWIGVNQIHDDRLSQYRRAHDTCPWEKTNLSVSPVLPVQR